MTLSKSKWINLFVIITCVLLPSLVRVLNYQSDRIHIDDILTAYFSVHYPITTANPFAGVPADGAQWVAKFPALYFILQKFFFTFFGATLHTIKYSVLPYVLLVSIFTYLIMKKLTNTFTALASLILIAFFPMSIYLETLGVHFIASTSVFLIFFYTMLRAFDVEKKSTFFWMGIWCGLCFMFYTSSYIALPLMIIVLLGYIINRKTKASLYNSLASILGFLLIMAPFIVYAKNVENYFFGRIQQVSLIGGLWSPIKNQAITNTETFNAIWKNLLLSLQSMTKHNIGGHGGYTFGSLAFFPPGIFILFLIGVVIALVLGRKNHAYWFILVSIISTFIIGVVFTVAPPAYHRLSLVFPFISMLCALPFFIIYKYIPKHIVYPIAAITLLFFSYSGQLYFQTSVKDERVNENIRLAKLINTQYPNRRIHVASYPGYVFEKIYYFIPGKNAVSIDTDYHMNYIKSGVHSESYVYVIIFPESYAEKFPPIDPNGHIIPFSPSYALFVN